MNETQLAFHIGSLGSRREAFLLSLLAACQGNVSQVTRLTTEDKPAPALSSAEDAASDAVAVRDWNANTITTSQLPEDAERILSFLRNNPKSSRNQIMSALGMTSYRYHVIMVSRKLNACLIKTGGSRGPHVRWSVPA